MALPTRCLNFFTLAGDILFMGLGLAAAVLQLVFVLPLVALLSLPSWLYSPLLLPLLPAIISIPIGFFAFRATYDRRRWRLIGLTVLQVSLAVGMGVLACWQVALWLGPRVGADMTILMNESVRQTKYRTMWDTIRHELQCCRPFYGDIPLSCCSRGGACDVHRDCIGPAVDRVRVTLRNVAAVCGSIAILQLLCAALSAFQAESWRRADKAERRGTVRGSARSTRETEEAPEDKPLRGPVIQNQHY